MSDMLIGPGQMCSECGRTYGQHDADCSNGIQRAIERKRQVEEDAITKADLLQRIEDLERAVESLKGGRKS